MTKLLMKAPKGTRSAEIEGHTYDIPKDGVIEVRNAGHVDTLRRHGFTDHEVAKSKEELIEEIGEAKRDWLETFLEERGEDVETNEKVKDLRKRAIALVEDQSE